MTSRERRCASPWAARPDHRPLHSVVDMPASWPGRFGKALPAVAVATVACAGEQARVCPRSVIFPSETPAWRGADLTLTEAGRDTGGV